MMNRLAKAGSNKKTPAKVETIERQPWTEPSEDAIPVGSKVLWGYWHTGRKNMPPFCELCVRTWEARHPNWTVVILSDSNYKTYVGPSDLPSTFESLKVQHRSDIIRFAVLKRFGGVYLDVSTVCMKSFDGIWDNPGDAEVMLGLPYDQKIDLWSLGCILAELWTGYVLFQNDSIQSMLARIIGIIGPIPKHIMTAGKFVPQYFTQDGQLYKEVEVPPQELETAGPELARRIHLYFPKRSSLRQRLRTSDEQFLDFLGCLLRLDPRERPSAREALEHPWLAKGRYSDGL